MLRQVLLDAAFFDLERDVAFRRINDGPALLLQEVDRPIVFDEGQLSPDLFRVLQIAVDQQRN